MLTDNLALNKPAFVKQHYHDNALAGLAVDGNTDPDRFKSFSCAVCGKVEQGWWAVDLGTNTRVGKVRLLARIKTQCKYNVMNVRMSYTWCFLITNVLERIENFSLSIPSM